MLAIIGVASTAEAQRPSTSPERENFQGGRQLSPLERLKNRSPFRRWRESTKGWEKSRTDRKQIPQIEPPESVLPPAPQAANPHPKPTRVAPAPLVATLQNPGRSERQPYPEPVRDPSKLKKVTSILPYFDYEPDEDTAKEDPCANLCPRPDGKPCKVYPPGTRVPECPEEVSLGSGVYEGRVIPDTVFNWQASNLYHNPLYFEDPALERYGHTHNDFVQPFVSVGRFGVQLLGLPYQMTIDPVRKKMFTLGWYRPGEWAPYKHYRIPWNREAAVRQAGVVTGLIFAVP